MSKARLVITAVITEGRGQGEVGAGLWGVPGVGQPACVPVPSDEGEAAFEPRSRRPRTSPTAIPDTTVELIVRLRKELSGQGLDAGPHTIAWHLEHHHKVKVSGGDHQPLPVPGRASHPPAPQAPQVVLPALRGPAAERVLAGRLHPLPTLASGTGTEILTWLDDHSRYVLSLTAHHRVTGPPWSPRSAAPSPRTAPRPPR